MPPAPCVTSSDRRRAPHAPGRRLASRSRSTQEGSIAPDTARRRIRLGTRTQLYRQETRPTARPELAPPREQQPRTDFVPLRDVLGNDIRRERLLHDAQLVLDRPTPSPLAPNPDLNLLSKIALKRPLKDLVRRLAHPHRRPVTPAISQSAAGRGRWPSDDAYGRCAVVARAGGAGWWHCRRRRCGAGGR
jgi:hypothetical protein